MVNSIVSNGAAFNAQGNIGVASGRAVASIARLSSGNRITKASDDVAGLATGTSLRNQVTTLRTSLQNASQGNSVLQVADGGLSQVVDILQRQKALAVQAGSGSLTDVNRALLNQEFQNLTLEVDRIAAGTNFNGVNLLSGGLGDKTRLATTNAIATGTISAAPALQGTPGNATRSGTAIQAFDINDGTRRSTLGIGSAGNLQFTDSNGNILADSAYDAVDGSAYGQFSKFEFSNVTYGAVGIGAATLTATLNGVQYSGNVVSSAGNTQATLRNGNTYITLALGPVKLTDAGSQATATNTITNLFSTLTITRTSTIQGVDFSGTALAGATGSNATGNAGIRLTTNGAATIGNFKYAGNGGVANSSTLTVQVNGKTFTAPSVNDQILGRAINFLGEGTTEVLTLDFSNLTTNIANIRTSTTDQANFINALNQGFARAGSGLNFTIGTGATDTIRIQFGSTSTASVYGGAMLDVSSATSATNAAAVLDNAITSVVSLRATVGALQSRFNFASNALQSSIENQDAARSALLDTDISAESSAFASAQVQLQAGIAVLAQSNKLPDDLLKLLEA